MSTGVCKALHCTACFLKVEFLDSINNIYNIAGKFV